MGSTNRYSIEKSMTILMITFLFGFVCLFSQGRAAEMDKLSGKNLKMAYSIEAGKEFQLIITDDSMDELASKGEVKFISSNVEFGQPFYLEKGKSAKWGVSPSDMVEKVIIELKEGSIFVDSGGKLKKESAAFKPQTTQKTVLLPQGSFSADMVIDDKGKIRTGKFYLLDHLYRFDITADGMRQSMIVDRKTGKVWLLDITDKAYAMTSTDDFGIYFFNPFEAHLWMTTKFKVTDKGEEKLGELLCEKKELMDGEVVVQRAWFSKKYRFLVKLINYDKNKQHYMMELRNIREGKINPEIFEVPKDFRLLK